MDLRRLRAGDWIVAISGAALLVSLFLPWYGQGRTAWEALTIGDVILFLIAAAAVGVLVATATHRVPAVPIALTATVGLLGIVATAFVAVRVIWLPGGVEGREWGLWLGLAGAVGVVAGGWIAVRDDSMPAVPPPPEAEALPAPRP
jgi:hypothetical protein